jgi:tRNA(fMet)-specific endonuclease VapC
MKVFDTDTLTLYSTGHPRIRQRAAQEDDEIAITVITQIEVLLGRFDFILKAADGNQLQRAQLYLVQSERDLAEHVIVPIDSASGAEFDRLRGNKKLKKIGRRDLLIACIALAHRATLVTRNLKHFRQVPGLQVENWAD